MRHLVVGGILWLAGQTVARQIISFVLFVVLGRILGPADFGVVSLSASVILILQTFSSQGITQAVIQRADLTESDAEVAYSFNLLTCLFIAGILIVGCGLYAHIFPQYSNVFTLVLAVLAMSLPLSASYEMHQARLARNFQFSVIARKALAGQVVGGLVAVGAAFAGAGVWSLVAQQIVALFIEFAVVRSASTWRPNFRIEKKFAIHLWRFGAHIFGARLLSTLDSRGTDLVIGIFSGQLSVGYFRLAKSMLDVVVSVFAAPISSVSLPLFASSQNDIQRVRRVFLRMTEALCWLLVPPCLTLVFWGPVILTFVLGPKWQSSGLLLQILSVQGTVLGMFYLYDPLLVALGRSRDVFVVRCWQTGMGLSCMLIAAPFGIQAIVAAQVVGLFLTAPIMFRYISLSTNLRFASFLAHIWKPNLLGGAFVVLAAVSERSVGQQYGILGLLGALTLSYLLYCISFYIFATRELRFELLGLMRRNALTNANAGRPQ